MTEGRWSDLAARTVSAVVLVLVGAIEVWLGGLWFETFIAAACGVMIWELVRMVAPDQTRAALPIGLLTAIAVIVSYHVPPAFVLPLLIAPTLVGLGQIKTNRLIYALFSLWIAGAGLGFIVIRESMGFGWMLWLILIVVATDVAGYFVGKAIGGRKFWPAISPKKTWSGTAGGWGAAAIVGIGFAVWGGMGVPLVLISVLASMASQAGDIAESALKRRMDTKDSSNLIPGHGGFLDRFDGMLGAALFVLVAAAVWSPEGM
jgi:phosphatidate cytidylyltransferase